MLLGSDRLKKDLREDAMHACGSYDHPAATLDWVDFGSTKCVLITFIFAATKRDGPKSGSLFRFFTTGVVYCHNWEGEEKFDVQGREGGYRFDSLGINQNLMRWDGSLEHFIDQVTEFTRECVNTTGIVLEDKYHV